MGFPYSMEFEKMAQRTEWKALSDHINGFSEALKLYLTLTKFRDVYGIAKKELLPHFYSIWNQVENYSNTYRSILSPQAGWLNLGAGLLT